MSFDDEMKVVLLSNAEKAATEPPEGCYMQDGLLYCRTCKKPRQARIRLLGDVRNVKVMCDCEAKAWEAQKAKQKAEERRLEAERMRRVCFDYPRLAQYTFAVDDRENAKLSDVCRRYVGKWEQVKADNVGLLLYGGCGTGKTFYAACIVNALLCRGVRCRMTSFPSIVNSLQSSFSGREDYINGLCSLPDLLVIDDLGAERSSDYMLEQVYAVIDARYQERKPLIITTNLPFGEIKNPADLKYKRIYDRILEITLPIKVTGESRRQAGFEDKTQSRKKLLGL